MFGPLAPSQLSLYYKLRILLWISIIVGGILFSLSILFPRIILFVDFNVSNPLKEADLQFSLSENPSFLSDGKITAHTKVKVSASHIGDFSSTTIKFRLEKNSPTPKNINVTIRKANQAAFLPIGEPIKTASEPTIFLVDNTYYLLHEKTLIPFISEAAYRSRYPEGHILAKTTSDIFRQYTKIEQPIGFRIGSLLSFADGVFIVMSETEIRPIGSAEIFLALGYHFENVKPVSEEELGIYNRGRIILISTPYGDGTLFRDRESDTVFITDQGMLRPIQNEEQRIFLQKEQIPIDIRLSDTQETISCLLTSHWFPQTYTCTTPINILEDNLGYSYEITIDQTEDTTIELRNLRISLDTHATRENAQRLLSKIKQSILARFGIAN